MKIKIACFLLLFLSLCGCVSGQTSLSENQIVLYEEKSCLVGDFDVRDDKVYFECNLVIDNLTSNILSVRINASSVEDVEGGLLKQCEMTGFDSGLTSDTFTLSGGENTINVIFVGEYAGREVKRDRLIPHEISFMIAGQQPVN